jgi:hypothetical protein
MFPDGELASAVSRLFIADDSFKGQKTMFIANTSCLLLF